jgi:hypothetical protein
MGREEPCDFHPIINEWEGEWVVSEPGNDLASMILEPRGGAGWTPMYTYVNS